MRGGARMRPVVAGLDEVAGLVARERSRRGRSPYLVAMTGGVAAGKSTLAAALAERLTPARVEVVTTDGFLHPNAVLAARGLTERKGFPESYDRERLVSFLGALSASETEVRAPVYSHLRYDVVPGAEQRVRDTDIVVVEGLGLLHDDDRPFFDCTVYVDAAEDDLERWFLDRMLTLRRAAADEPDAFYHAFVAMSEGDTLSVGRAAWRLINGANLREHILPLRDRADIVIEKGPAHQIIAVRFSPERRDR